MFTSKSRYLATTAVILIAGVSSAAAGSFALKERTAVGQGASFAGATSQDSDISFSGFNPAALRATGERYSLAGSLSAVIVSSDGDVSDGTSVDPGETGFVPSLYIARRINQDLVAGLAVYAPFGLATEYPDTWTGAGDATRSELTSVAISPTMSYDVSPTLTLGAALNVFVVDAELGSAATTLEGDSVEFGAHVGLLWDATPATTVGFSYQTGYKIEADGTFTGATSAPATFEADLPATLSLGVTHDLTPAWTVMGEVQWQDWSVFDAIEIDATGVGVISDPQNYDDAFFVALGAEFAYAPNITLRSGIAWDQTPTNDDILIGTATNRTARVPDADRIWLSVGGSYELASGTSIDVGYSYLFGLEDSTVGLRTVGETVEYEASAHIFSIGGSMSF